MIIIAIILNAWTIEQAFNIKIKESMMAQTARLLIPDLMAVIKQRGKQSPALSKFLIWGLIKIITVTKIMKMEIRNKVESLKIKVRA